MTSLKLNGINVNGYIGYPENKNGPGVLVLHAWWGLNKFIQQFCEKLANEGFFVVAPDLYNGKIANTIEQAEEYVQKIDNKIVNPILKKTVDFLLTQQNCSSSKLSVIGFSLGASWASWLANNKPDEIEKVVLFYGTGEVNFTNTKASFLCHFAENDPYEEPEYVKYFLESLQKANVKASHHTYPNTHHWFFESDKTEYFNEGASKLAWKRSLEFLFLSK
ncbi:MAG: dienelactone hydrolase family protein [Candidatus Thorarchaeota archaeon]